MNTELKTNVTRRSTWLRALYMLLFVVIYGVAEVVLAAVVVLQFLYTLFTGSTIERLLVFGRSLSMFIYQILLFLTYNTEVKPYPFGSWPTQEPEPEKQA